MMPTLPLKTTIVLTRAFLWVLIATCAISNMAQAQSLFGGSFERRAAVSLVHKQYSYAFACTFYADAAGRDALPNQLRFKLFRKRDNVLVREFVALKQPNPVGKTIMNECSAINARSDIELFSVVYLHEVNLNPAEFNDSEGYYVINEAPPVNRAVSSNVKSEKLVLYHWFSPQYLFQNLDNATEGRATTGLEGEYSFQCRNEGKSIRPKLNVSPYIQFFDPDALDLSAIRGKPLTEGTLPLQEVEWLAGYSSTNPNGGDYFINDSKPKFDNNSDVTHFEAWAVPPKLGIFVLAFITEQRRNGVKLAENSLEIFSEVNDCIKPLPIAVTVTEAGTNVTANTVFCKDKPVQLNAQTVETDLEFQWYANDKAIAGANAKTLRVTESGAYLLKAKKKGLCGEINTVTINLVATNCNLKGPPQILGHNIHDLVNTVGTMLRNYINQHVFRAIYYTPLSDLSKMPTIVRGTIYRKRDNQLVDEIIFKRNTTADLTHHLDRICDTGKDTVQQVTYDVSHNFGVDKYSDDMGYYLTTEPICCRADADNLARKGSSMVGSLDIGPANRVKGMPTIQRGHTVDLNIPFTMQGCVNKPSRVYLYAGNRENITAKFDDFAEILGENDANANGARKVTWVPGHSADNFTGNTNSKFVVEERRNGVLVLIGTPEKPGVFVYRLKIDGVMTGDAYSSVYQEFRLEVNDCTRPPKPTTFISKVGRPMVAASPELCQDSLVQLNVRGGRTWGKYQWYKGKTAIYGEDDSVLVVPANQSGAYRCLIKMIRVCPDTIGTDPVQITYLPKPTANITATRASICEGQSIMLNAETNADRVVWNFEETNIGTALTQTVDKKGDYTIKVTDAKGCTNTSKPFRVMAGALPTAEIARPSRDFVCEGQTLTLIATQAAGNKYVWKNADGATLPQATSTLTIGRPGTYSVTITDQNGCVNTSNTFTVRQLVNPTVSITSAADVFCENQTLTLSAKTDVVGGERYQWFVDNVQTNNQTNTLTANKAGEYLLKVTDVNGCVGTSIAKKITVNKLPLSDITAPNRFFCGGGSVTLTANEAAGLSYKWLLNGVVIDSTKSIQASRVGNYTLQATSAEKCKQLSTAVNIQQFPVPNVSITAPMTRFCKGESLMLTSKADNIKTYSWALDNQPLSGPNEIPDFMATKGGSYTVKVVDNNGCTATSKSFFAEALDPIVVTIDSIPEFCGYAFPPIKLNGNPPLGVFSGKGVNDFTFAPRTAGVGLHNIIYTVKGELSCLSGKAQRSIRIKPAPALDLGDEIELYRGRSTKLGVNMGVGYVYSWTPPMWIDDVSAVKPTVNPDETIYYTLLAISPANCASEDSVKVKVIQGLHFPTAFSPNGDGQNDTWDIVGIADYPNIEVYIYNRWGNLVFEGKGSNMRPFDGTANGQPLPMGVYSYIVKENTPKNLVYKGSITLVR